RDPADRWPDAASFRHALWRTRVWRYRRNTIGVAVGCTLAGMAIVVLWTAPPTTVRLEVGAASSIPGLAPWLADSVACGLARDLDRYPARPTLPPALSTRPVGSATSATRRWVGGSTLRTTRATITTSPMSTRSRFLTSD